MEVPEGRLSDCESSPRRRLPTYRDDKCSEGARSGTQKNRQCPWPDGREYKRQSRRIKREIAPSHRWSEMRQKGLVSPTPARIGPQVPGCIVRTSWPCARPERTPHRRARARRRASLIRPSSPQVIHAVCGNPRLARPGPSRLPPAGGSRSARAAGSYGRPPDSARGGMPDAVAHERPAREPGLQVRGRLREIQGTAPNGQRQGGWPRIRRSARAPRQRGGSRAVSSAVSRRVGRESRQARPWLPCRRPAAPPGSDPPLQTMELPDAQPQRPGGLAVRRLPLLRGFHQAQPPGVPNSHEHVVLGVTLSLRRQPMTESLRRRTAIHRG